MIEEKARLVQLLDEYISGDGLTIVIGSEHHAPDLQRFTLIASTYTDGRGTGAVGVIGPTRMRYSRAINAVESLSQDDQPDGRRPRLIYCCTPFVRRTMEDNRTDPDIDLSEASETAGRVAAAEATARLAGEHGRPRRRAPAGTRRVQRSAAAEDARSSTTTASAPSASGRRSPKRLPPICSTSCCRSSTTSSARSRRTPAAREPRPIAAASS